MLRVCAVTARPLARSTACGSSAGNTGRIGSTLPATRSFCPWEPPPSDGRSDKRIKGVLRSREALVPRSSVTGTPALPLATFFPLALSPRLQPGSLSCEAECLLSLRPVSWTLGGAHRSHPPGALVTWALSPRDYKQPRTRRCSPAPTHSSASFLLYTWRVPPFGSHISEDIARSCPS